MIEIETEKILDLEKLENLLVSHWSEFLEVRKILDFIKIVATKHFKTEKLRVEKIIISRFELSTNGFIVWIDSTINLSNPTDVVNTNMTSEVLLDFSGHISHQMSM